MNHKKSVLATGRAEEKGAGIFRSLAKDGNAVTIGDINVAEGGKLVTSRA